MAAVASSLPSTASYENNAESDVSAASYTWSADAATCMVHGTVTPPDGPERYAVLIVKPNAGTTPTQQSDSGTITIPEFYMCQEMVLSADASANVVTFTAILWECLNGNCALEAGGHHAVTVTGRFISGVWNFDTQPAVGGRTDTANFTTSYTGATEQFFFPEGTTNRITIPIGGFIDSHTDLHKLYWVPNLNAHSVVILINDSVSFAGGRPEFLFKGGCQVSEQLHSTTTGPNRQQITNIMDPIAIGHEGGYGGVVNQETWIAVAPANAIPFTADQLSTNKDKLCRSQTVFYTGGIPLPLRGLKDTTTEEEVGHVHHRLQELSEEETLPAEAIIMSLKSSFRVPSSPPPPSLPPPPPSPSPSPPRPGMGNSTGPQASGAIIVGPSALLSLVALSALRGFATLLGSR